jgi:hypothetical protein
MMGLVIALAISGLIGVFTVTAGMYADYKVDRDGFFGWAMGMLLVSSFFLGLLFVQSYKELNVSYHQQRIIKIKANAAESVSDFEVNK